MIFSFTIDTADLGLRVILSSILIIFVMGGYGIKLYNRGYLEGYRTHAYLLVMLIVFFASTIEFMR